MNGVFAKRLTAPLILALALVLAMAVPTAARAAELAEKLPADKTIVYGRLDVGRILGESGKYLLFLDAESGARVVFQVKELHKLLKEVAAEQDMQAKILDATAGLKVHFVLTAKDEPEIKTHTYKSPKWNPETGEPIPGEFEEETYTTKEEYNFSLVLDTTPDVAADFLKQFKAMLVRKKENDPGAEGPAYKEVEVDQGEMISDGDDGSTVGQLGGYVVISDGKPNELWAALTAGPAKPLAESALYRRFAGEAGEAPLAMLLVNIESLVVKAEQSLRDELAEAKKAAGDGGEEGQWMVDFARESLQSFLNAKKVFSLDKIKAAGFNARLSVKDGEVVSEWTGALQVSDPVSTALKMILDGGRKFELPAIGEREAMCLMFRLGAQEVFDEYLKVMGEEDRKFYNEAMAEMKQEVGCDISEILKQLAGDFYVFLDLVNKEHEVMDWNEETGEIETKKVTEPLPEFLVLLGLKDREACAEMISKIFTTLSTQPEGGQFVRKRTYQETDVYLIGDGVGREDAKPDGINAFAVVLVGRCLSFGTWDDVTALIRKARAADAGGDNGALTAAVGRHKDANVLLAMPKKFNAKVQKMIQEDAGEDPVEMALESLEMMALPIENEEIQTKVKDSLKALLEEIKTLQAKALELSPEVIVGHGQYQEGFYEFKIGTKLKK